MSEKQGWARLLRTIRARRGKPPTRREPAAWWVGSMGAAAPAGMNEGFATLLKINR